MTQNFDLTIIIQQGLLPAHSDNKNVISQIKRYNRWLHQTQGNLYQPDLVAYRDYLLENLAASSAKVHLSNVRRSYKMLINNLEHRDALITYLEHHFPEEDFATIKAKADEIAAKMEEQRIRRIKRRQQRQQKRRVGILGGFVRTALITIISAVLASTIFTWFTDPEFFTSNVVSGLQVANATSVAVIDPLTPTVLAVTPNWARRIGIVSGHRGPENDPGAVCDDGLTEREINFAVAQLVVLGLRENGYSVDLLDEFDPRLDAYQAAALVSIHANDCQDYGEFVSGYLVARAAARPAGGFDDILAECIARDYGKAVDIERRFSLTVDMTDYHTFREINSLTPAAILELGFMRADRDLLVNQQDIIAGGIIEGILCFLNGETPFEDEPSESPTPETNVGITPLPLNDPTATGE